MSEPEFSLALRLSLSKPPASRKTLDRQALDRQTLEFGLFGLWSGQTFETRVERSGGLAGVLRRFWVVPTPKIGFRPLSIHKSETNLRNRFVSNNLVWNW